MFPILEHDHVKVSFYLKATLYDPKNDSKSRDVTPKMLFILGLRYRSHYRCYSYIFFVKQLYFLEIQMACFVLFQCEISYSKLASYKSIDLSQRRKLFEIIRCLICLVFLVFVFRFIRSAYYYHADSFYDILPLMQVNIQNIVYLNCGERYEGMIDHRNQNPTAWKKFICDQLAVGLIL